MMFSSVCTSTHLVLTQKLKSQSSKLKTQSHTALINGFPSHFMQLQAHIYAIYSGLKKQFVRGHNSPALDVRLPDFLQQSDVLTPTWLHAQSR